MRGAKRQSRDKVPRAGLRQEVNPITEPRLFGLLSSTPLSSGVGAETQRPLATVVVGGLMTSTALTLLILPLIYEWSELRRQAKESKAAFASAEEGAKP